MLKTFTSADLWDKITSLFNFRLYFVIIKCNHMIIIPILLYLSRDSGGLSVMFPCTQKSNNDNLWQFPFLLFTSKSETALHWVAIRSLHQQLHCCQTRGSSDGVILKAWSWKREEKLCQKWVVGVERDLSEQSRYFLSIPFFLLLELCDLCIGGTEGAGLVAEVLCHDITWGTIFSAAQSLFSKNKTNFLHPGF